MPPRKIAALLFALPSIFHDAATVPRRRVLQGREQDLQGDVAFENGPEVIKHDHLVGIGRDQLEESHRRQMPALVDVDFPDFLLQDRPHGMRLGGAGASVEVKAGCVLPSLRRGRNPERSPCRFRNSARYSGRFSMIRSTVIAIHRSLSSKARTLERPPDFSPIWPAD